MTQSLTKTLKKTRVQAKAAPQEADSVLRPEGFATRQDLIEAHKQLVEALAAMEKAQALQREENRKVIAALERVQTLHHEENEKAQAAMEKHVVDALAISQEKNRKACDTYREENAQTQAAMDKRLTEAIAMTWKESKKSQTVHLEASQKALSAMDERVLDGIAVHREAVAVYRESMAKAVSDLRLEIRVVSNRLWLMFGGLVLTVLIGAWS